MAGKVLVIGSGGREHAIVWKLSQSEKVKNIYALPGSDAIQQVEKVRNVDIDVKNFKEIAQWCKTNEVELVVVGPEDPLANGIADVLLAEGIHVFGPRQHAAQIESDKDWAKAFMDRHNIPTAKWKSFTDAKGAKEFINNSTFPALVVKASGLAAGKGVVVAVDIKEACSAVDDILTDKKFGIAGETVVVEELLQGEEVSVLAFCDGTTVRAMLPAQDHKRIFDGDEGPNTGGMGAYCPCPLVNEEQLAFVQTHILQKTVDGLKQENIKFVGVLYAGLMLTSQGPKVLEFNCRFGDPETEVILPLLESDLYAVMMACCNETLGLQQLKWKENICAVGVVMASRGYPETSSKGQVITGIDDVNRLPNHIVFQCGTALKEENIVTNGGRVLIAVSLAPQLAVAAAHATRACEIIKFEGEQHRRDISHKGVASFILQRGRLTYKDSGVNITAGDNLVNNIKAYAKATTRSGTVGGLGGFGGIFDVKAAGFTDPLLVSGTDGVGTKLKIAQQMGCHDTIGIDLVAMCVNDVLAHGAEPLFFLDYYACGKLNVKLAEAVVSGISEGCKLAECSLVGGETAEMPDMYHGDDYDVAGFTVGAVERNRLLPRTDIVAGDVVIGLPSSGLHSNGFSLVRRVMNLTGHRYTEVAPFSDNELSFGLEFLKPTKIYVKALKPVLRSGKLKAFAHITGGGLVENVPRILPNNVGVELDASKWAIPPVFGWLATVGDINECEILRTLNCGIGAVLIIAKQDERQVLNLLVGNSPVVVGKVVSRKEKPVVINNFSPAMTSIMRTFVPSLINFKSVPKKRVGVLISGSGTNLQALIDATLDPVHNIDAEIVCVISNKANVKGLERAQLANIPTKVLNHKDYNSREEFDQAMHEELLSAHVDIVCLAGFMRILSGEFTRKWKGRLLNIHPALLPLFKGMHAQKQALDAGVRVSGCTVHFVEEDVDAGAMVVQQTVPIELNDTEEILTERIKEAEHKAYPHALHLVASGKVKLGDNNKLIWKM